LRSFFAKRLSKVVIPLVVWSIVYILWKRFYADGIALSITSFYSFLLKPEYYHLWFLYVIIGLYLYTPILRVLVQNATIELLCFFLALWVFAVFFLPFLEKAVDINSRIDLKMISGYVGYMVLGHLLGKIQVTRKIFWVSIATFFTMLFSTAMVTYALTEWKNGGYFGDFYSYLAGNIIVMSAAAFLSLRYISEKIRFMAFGPSAQFLRKINSTTLGIYLIHPMILLILKRGDLGFSLSCFSFKAVYSLPLTAAVTFSISFVVIHFIRKIPVVQKCVP
jgi:surface polysaccharide O-acyltransferase-like enzyme